ncbi:MAG: hypothetical protein CVU01_02900 [Bacteroidetes bacterium HGW-Bacteroidetes-18]|nr:MAG: hypothetical protein CVU01_02900 [Bacteroidetes bacterium HGW-Bacteroidetes-18]
MNRYKGITFAKGYNKSFAEFKEEFGSTHVFKSIHPSKREQELKKAYKIATDGITSKTKGKGKEDSAE